MDAPEADFDVKLQKISADLLREFDTFLPTFLIKKDRNATQVVPSPGAHLFDSRADCFKCLDPFQELPQLLDPHLPKWIPYLSQAFLDYAAQSKRSGGRKGKEEQAKHLVSTDYAICKILYTLCKIRGEKVVVHFLNVEAKYLEVLLSAIEDAESKEVGDEAAWSWEQRYVVLLWLSHLMLAPFDLSTVSSVDLEDVSTTTVPGLVLLDALPGITSRVIPLAIKYLASPGKERDGAKALLVRMAMRRDMQQLGLLKSLIQWSISALRPSRDAPPEATYYFLGVLSFLAGMLRSAADTSDMNDFLRPIFDVVHGISTDESEDAKSITSFALARKMIIKVVRSVIVSLLRQGKQNMESTEMTETAIGYLLESLSDSDTPVRLAASKSLSIVTLKLDPEMASQVVEAVLESLNRNVLWKKTLEAKPLRDLSAVDHLEWHGLILTLSHLLYRRSPPADQLSDIIHALLLGLSFEQRGTSGTSVGSNVRDAACFGIWALARRYTTDELLAVPTNSVYTAKAHPSVSSILQVLGTELVTTACLDPAGNIRRGSSAALQELIGRHPDTVEKGIWVVQTVDYHDVARRSKAMRDVALGVTQLASQYGNAIIEAVHGWRGVGDPDAPSRRDAGGAFGVLTTELMDSTSDDVLSRLDSCVNLLSERLKSLVKRQVEERHGLLLCFAAILEQVPALLKESRHGKSVSQLVAKVLSVVTWILDDCKTTAYRRPEFVVEAASRLVVSLLPILQLSMLDKPENLQLSTMDQLISTRSYSTLVSALNTMESQQSEITELLSGLQEIIPLWLARSEPETVEPASLAALTLLLFSDQGSRATIMANWAEMAKDRPKSRTAAQGGSYFYTLAMAQPLVSTLGSKEDIVCDALLSRWKRDPEIETRLSILQALTRSPILHEKPMAFLDLLHDGLNDYTTTARGDVGSHVRVQALRAVRVLWEHLPNEKPKDVQKSESVKRLIYSVLRLSAEKLDRVRPEAQVVLSLCLTGESAERFRDMTFSSKAYFTTMLNLFHDDQLHPIVATQRQANTDLWSAEILAGYVTSADTGNEDLVIASRAALTDFCFNDSGLNAVAQALMANLKTRQGNDRVIVPTLEIIAFLFHVRLFQSSKGVNVKTLCLYTQKAGYKTGNVRKIEACVRVYGGISSMDDVEDVSGGIRAARKRLGALLIHPWPKVRVMVVDELWGLLGSKEESGDKLFGVDWGEAKKEQIQNVVKELRLD